MAFIELGGTIGLRKRILNLFGHKITTMYADCHIGRGQGRIFMEEGSYCNANCFFDLNDDIFIGRNVLVGFITTTHDIETVEKRASKTQLFPIKIGEGCWKEVVVLYFWELLSVTGLSLVRTLWLSQISKQTVYILADQQNL